MKNYWRNGQYPLWFAALAYRLSLLLAIEMALGIYLAFFCGGKISPLFSFDNPLLGELWSAISVILVIQATNKDSIDAAWLRLLGSFIGAVISGCVMSLLDYSPTALCITVLCTVIVCSLFKLDTAIRLSCVTILVISLTGYMQTGINPWQNATGRFCESLLGVLIAIIIVLPLRPLRRKMRLIYEAGTAETSR